MASTEGQGDAGSLTPKLDLLVKKAGNSVTEQELRPILERMAGMVGRKVWYVTEKGDIEVSELVQVRRWTESGVAPSGGLGLLYPLRS